MSGMDLILTGSIGESYKKSNKDKTVPISNGFYART
jgi:hypothetical protein